VTDQRVVHSVVKHERYDSFGGHAMVPLDTHQHTHACYVTQLTNNMYQRVVCVADVGLVTVVCVVSGAADQNSPADSSQRHTPGFKSKQHMRTRTSCLRPRQRAGEGKLLLRTFVPRFFAISGACA
jgi:hypothetical protein